MVLQGTRDRPLSGGHSWPAPASTPERAAPSRPPSPRAGRDLHSALQVTAGGTGQRLFGWARRGKRVAYEIAKVRTEPERGFRLGAAAAANLFLLVQGGGHPVAQLALLAGAQQPPTVPRPPCPALPAIIARPSTTCTAAAWCTLTSSRPTWVA